jgi:hypothetical protein
MMSDYTQQRILAAAALDDESREINVVEVGLEKTNKLVGLVVKVHN